VLFEAGLRQEIESRLTLEAELALAAERGEFELFYQPQVNLGSGELMGAEALIRGNHPVRGRLSPGNFHAGRQYVVGFGADRRLGAGNRLPAGTDLGIIRASAARRRQLVAVATDLLTTMGCKEGQGYFFARPLPVPEFETQFLASTQMPAAQLAN
jgi:sensor c-di-GMP phosphodiesterase-like protein